MERNSLSERTSPDIRGTRMVDNQHEVRVDGVDIMDSSSWERISVRNAPSSDEFVFAVRLTKSCQPRITMMISFVMSVY